MTPDEILKHLESPVTAFGVGEIEAEGDRAQAIVECAREFEGGPGVAHGGWIAAVFDEFIGLYLHTSGRLAVTSELHVRFRRPVPIERALHLECACVNDVAADRLEIEATMSSNTSRVELATARGTWVRRTPDHWSRAQASLADDSGWR